MIITQLIFLTKRKNSSIIYTESEVMKDMKYYCIDENSLEYLQSGLGILVKITDANNQKTCNYGYGVFDAQTHKVFMFKEVFRKKPQEFYSTKFEEED